MCVRNTSVINPMRRNGLKSKSNYFSISLPDLPEPPTKCSVSLTTVLPSGSWWRCSIPSPPFSSSSLTQSWSNKGGEFEKWMKGRGERWIDWKVEKNVVDTG